MTNTELIRQEIERQMSLWWEKLPDADKDTATWTQDEVKALGEYMAYENLLDFIDSLPKETVTGCCQLEEEIQKELEKLGGGYGGWNDGLRDEDLRDFARHFAKWGAEHLKK